jgi:hypothetical protein
MNQSTTTSNPNGLTSSGYIAILVGLALVNTLVLLARGFYFSYAVLSSQESLSIEVLRRLVGSPLSFFHTTPLGMKAFTVYFVLFYNLEDEIYSTPFVVS